MEERLTEIEIRVDFGKPLANFWPLPCKRLPEKEAIFVGAAQWSHCVTRNLSLYGNYFRTYFSTYDLFVYIFFFLLGESQSLLSIVAAHYCFGELLKPGFKMW